MQVQNSQFCERGHEQKQQSIIEKAVPNLPLQENSRIEIGKIRHAFCIQKPKRRRVDCHRTHAKRQKTNEKNFHENTAFRAQGQAVKDKPCQRCRHTRRHTNPRQIRIPRRMKEKADQIP